METEVIPIMSLLQNYLPLSGGTMTGDINLGANKLKTTSLLLKELNAVSLIIRDAADANPRDLTLRELDIFGDVAFSADSLGVRADNVNDHYAYLGARDTGVGPVEVARLQGAADPYFQATLPMVLNPSAIPGTLVEGHFGYDSVTDKLWYKTALATKYIMAEAALTTKIDTTVAGGNPGVETDVINVSGQGCCHIVQNGGGAGGTNKVYIDGAEVWSWGGATADHIVCQFRTSLRVTQQGNGTCGMVLKGNYAA